MAMRRSRGGGERCQSQAPNTLATTRICSTIDSHQEDHPGDALASVKTPSLALKLADRRETRVSGRAGFHLSRVPFVFEKSGPLLL